MHHVAIDIGASGGTVYLGRVTASTFAVTEVHRFDNRPVADGDRHVWGLDALRRGMIDGLRAADDAADGDLDYVGIDTWGLDFGLCADGEVLRRPTSYRDPDAIASRDALFERVDRRTLFEATGITHWNTPNTLWQLYTVAQREPELLDEADSLLLMPQLLATLLGGDSAGEVTVASTTQMVDPGERTWATDLLDELDLPTALLPDLDEPGRDLGPVDSDIAKTISSTPEILSPASHDTAAAVAGLPLTENAAFLNTGSWFIMGVERDDPVRTDAAFEHSFANELGVDETVRLLKNVNGFFLLEECREAWAAAGQPTNYERLLAAAREAPARQSLVDPDADAFNIEGSMPEQIRAYCRETEQPVPESQGAVVRCLLDSLVAKTALVFDHLRAVTEDSIDAIALGGGGVRNELFCRLLADATGVAVRAGPIEATAIGNLLTQAVAAGSIDGIDAGRRLVEREFEPTVYEPSADADWQTATDRVSDLDR